MQNKTVQSSLQIIENNMMSSKLIVLKWKWMQRYRMRKIIYRKSYRKRVKHTARIYQKRDMQSPYC